MVWPAAARLRTSLGSARAAPDKEECGSNAVRREPVEKDLGLALARAVVEGDGHAVSVAIPTPDVGGQRAARGPQQLGGHYRLHRAPRQQGGPPGPRKREGDRGQGVRCESDPAEAVHEMDAPSIPLAP